MNDSTDICVGSSDCPYLYRFSILHDLAALIFYAIQKRNIEVDKETEKLFVYQQNKALYQCAKRWVAIDEIRSILSCAKIPFILLKGAVTMRLYPEPYLRTSSDIDVLVRSEDYKKAVQSCLNAGFTQTLESEYDVSFKTQANYHVELHHSLIEGFRYPNDTNILNSVWDYAYVTDPGAYEYNMMDEMFYFYHIAHMIKHFENGGCGVRAFIDLWLLNHKVVFDEEKRNNLLCRGGLLTFEKRAKELSEMWFSGNEANAELDDFAEYIIKGGVYGTTRNAVAVRKAKTENRFRYYFERIFLPYKYSKSEYPLLHKMPFLLPYFWVVRWFKLFDFKTRNKALSELSLEKVTGKEQIEKTKELMKQLGIYQTLHND